LIRSFNTVQGEACGRFSKLHSVLIHRRERNERICRMLDIATPYDGDIFGDAQTRLQYCGHCTDRSRIVVAEYRVRRGYFRRWAEEGVVCRDRSAGEGRTSGGADAVWRVCVAEEKGHRVLSRREGGWALVVRRSRGRVVLVFGSEWSRARPGDTDAGAREVLRGDSTAGGSAKCRPWVGRRRQLPCGESFASLWSGLAARLGGRYG
jgi:hypothetical protein